MLFGERGLRGLLDLGLGCVGSAELNVVGDRARKHHHLLGYERDVGAKVDRIEIVQ